MRRRLPYILAFAIPFLVYLPTLTGTFYYDDTVIFFGHQVQALAAHPFSVFSAKAQYIPGTPRSIHVFSLLMIYKEFGTSPLPYHVFNLLMHSATTLLVFVLLRRLLSGIEGAGSTAPLLGSLIFGLNPIHMENIAFVTLGGTDIFYTFWAMLSLVCYIGFRDKAIKGRANLALLAGSALAFYFALLSKESAVAFVLVYPLTEYVLGRRGYLWALPHAAVLLLAKSSVLTGAAAMALKEIANSAPGASVPSEMIKSLGFFAKSMVVPYPHMPYIKEFPGAPLLYAFVGLTALWLAAGLITRKRLVTYSALWFSVVSVPYMFVPTIIKNVAITAERYVYAPSIGLALLAGWAIAARWGDEKLRPKIKAAVICLLVIYGVLGTVYFYQAWRTEEDFWRYAIKTNPDYVSAYANLATIELQKGNIEEGRDLLLKGLDKKKGLPEEFSQAAYELANMYGGEGDLTRAEKYYKLSLSHADFEFSDIELGFLYLDAKRWDEAREALEGALRFRRSPKVLAGLALASLRLGDKKAAGAYASEAYNGARDDKLRDFASGIMKEAAK